MGRQAGRQTELQPVFVLASLGWPRPCYCSGNHACPSGAWSRLRRRLSLGAGLGDLWQVTSSTGHSCNLEPSTFCADSILLPPSLCLNTLLTVPGRYQPPPSDWRLLKGLGETHLRAFALAVLSPWNFFLLQISTWLIPSLSSDLCPKSPSQRTLPATLLNIAPTIPRSPLLHYSFP